MIEETCKAKVLRQFKVPSGEFPSSQKGMKAVCLQDRQRCTESFRSLHKTVQLPAKLGMQFAVCFQCLCLGQEIPATLSTLEDTGLARALQEFVLWLRPSEWPCLGGGRAECVLTWVAVTAMQELRRATEEPRLS